MSRCPFSGTDRELCTCDVCGANRSYQKPIYEYLEDIFIGGNHLASALLNLGMRPSEWRNAVYDDVLARWGQPAADIWVAWKAIMRYGERAPMATRLLGRRVDE